jgi:hypothetical protein
MLRHAAVAPVSCIHRGRCENDWPGVNARIMSNDAQFATAAHLHVQLRRKSGRVIDTIWMMHNGDYAREVLRLARAQGDEELARLAARYEELAPLAPSAPSAPPAPTEPASTGDYNASWEAKYRGGVR